MKLYGIFDANKSYTLLRYSELSQTENTYTTIDEATRQLVVIKEVCIADVEYNSENIGKKYDNLTKLFS